MGWVPTVRHGSGVAGVTVGCSPQLTCETAAVDSVGGQHVDEAVAEMVAVLMAQEHLDWQVRAGSLEWSCWKTAAHVAHDLAAYAGQLAGRATAGYLPFDLVISPAATPREILGAVTAFGRLLGEAVDNAGTGPVAWHWGMSDAAGFAAMGVAEVIVHTYDITEGLGVTWLPPEPLCQLVVARLFAGSSPGRASEVLLWATGRTDLTGHPRVGEWVWRAGKEPTAADSGSDDEGIRATLRRELKKRMLARDRDAVSAIRCALAKIENAEAQPIGEVGQAELPAGATVSADVSRRVVTDLAARVLVEAEVAELVAAAADYRSIGRAESATTIEGQAAVLRGVLSHGA